MTALRKGTVAVEQRSAVDDVAIRRNCERRLHQKRKLRMATSAALLDLNWPARNLLGRNRAAVFFAIALASQRRFQAALFSGRNVEGMAFNFTNDVFLLYLAFEAAERAFQRLVIAELYFCQTISPAFQSWQFLDLTFAARGSHLILTPSVRKPAVEGSAKDSLWLPARQAGRALKFFRSRVKCVLLSHLQHWRWSGELRT